MIEHRPSADALTRQRYERAAELLVRRASPSILRDPSRGAWLDGHHYLFRHDGEGGEVQHWLVDAGTGAVSTVSPSADQAAAPPSALALHAPDGRHAIEIDGYDLALLDKTTGARRALTSDGTPLQRYGQQSETCLAWLSYARTPYPVGLWSPGSDWFLTHRIDDGGLPQACLVEGVANGVPITHRFGYPVAGDARPAATIVAINIRTGTRRDFAAHPFLVAAFSPFTFRHLWFASEAVAYGVRFDRYWRKVELIRFDLASGEAQVRYEENVADGYVELHPFLVGTPNIRTIETSRELIVASEREDEAALWLHDLATGACKRRLSPRGLRVTDLVHVDEARRRIFFLAQSGDGAGPASHRALYVAGLDGTGLGRLVGSAEDVLVAVDGPMVASQDRADGPAFPLSGVSPDAGHAILRSGNIIEGDRLELLDLSTGARRTLVKSDPTGDAVARPVRALAADGRTMLDAVLLLPAGHVEGDRYPLVAYIYPGRQLLHRPRSHSAQRSDFARALSQLGFAVLMLDTRGTPAGGRAFHQAGYPSLLEPLVADHAAVIRQLTASHGAIDARRVGVVGWSAGGAAVVQAMLHHPDLFEVGVAICGNYDATRYSAAWSDKYAGPTAARHLAAEWARTIGLPLRGRLLLMAGDMDENVHVSQTTDLAEAMMTRNDAVDLRLVAGGGHDMILTNPEAQKIVWDYLVTHLKGETPPIDFGWRFSPGHLAAIRGDALAEARQ